LHRAAKRRAAAPERLARRNCGGKKPVVAALVGDDPAPGCFKRSSPEELGNGCVCGLLEFAVNAQLNAANCQQIDPRFRLAGLDLVADPELPLPDARRSRNGNGIFYTPVMHGESPAALSAFMLSTDGAFPLVNIEQPWKY
jgi:hypothetical protein